MEELILRVKLSFQLRIDWRASLGTILIKHQRSIRSFVMTFETRLEWMENTYIIDYKIINTFKK